MYDFGYDISDFKEIQPEYGTMNDFENLVKEARRLGNWNIIILTVASYMYRVFRLLIIFIFRHSRIIRFCT